MSSDTVIRVEKLGKRYRLGELNHNRSLREQLCKWLSWPLRRGRCDRQAAVEPEERRPEKDILWALRDVSFEIRRGDVVGFVGANGAGKSTLLKILARIIEPTEGEAEIRGRVGSLLEVGTGFHPELTGRENVYLNGAILGMSRSEIRKKFDEIVDFAGVAAFLDTPVKRYSSGMAVRLAFAVAAHLDPELLIIDEVLAVGDAEFQRKCLGKMGDVARDGRTVLFVSHNMQAVSTLCNRAVLIEQGRITMQDEPVKVVHRYLGGLAAPSLERRWDDPAAAPGNDAIRVHRLCVAPVRGGGPDAIDVHTPIDIECQYWNLRPGVKLNLSLHLTTSEGVTAFTTTTIHESEWHGLAFPAGLFRSRLRIPGDFLNDKRYAVEIIFVRDCTVPLFSCKGMLSFDVHEYERDAPWFGTWQGAVRPRLDWTTEMIEEQSVDAGLSAA